MKVLDVQLFVLLHAGSIEWRPIPFRRGARRMEAPFIGRKNVASTVKTLWRRRWLRWVDYQARKVGLQPAGEAVLQESIYAALHEAAE